MFTKGQGGGPKSSALVVAMKRDPRTVDLIIGGYLSLRKTGRSALRAENLVIREILEVSSQTIARWRGYARNHDEPYRTLFEKIHKAEEAMREEMFGSLDAGLRLQPYRYLEKMFVDWREDSLNKEAVESRAQQIASDKLVKLSKSIDSIFDNNPDIPPKDLLIAALEYLSSED